MKKMKIVEQREICKFGSIHFPYIIHRKKLRNLQEKSRILIRSIVIGF